MNEASTAADLRRCPVCSEDKPVGDFPPRTDRPSGRMSRCRPCDAARSRARYAAGKRRSPEAEERRRERHRVRDRARRLAARAAREERAGA